MRSIGIDQNAIHVKNHRQFRHAAIVATIDARRTRNSANAKRVSKYEQQTRRSNGTNERANCSAVAGRPFRKSDIAASLWPRSVATVRKVGPLALRTGLAGRKLDDRGVPISHRLGDLLQRATFVHAGHSLA